MSDHHTDVAGVTAYWRGVCGAASAPLAQSAIPALAEHVAGHVRLLALSTGPQRAIELRIAGETLLVASYLDAQRLGFAAPGGVAQAIAGLYLVDEAFALSMPADTS